MLSLFLILFFTALYLVARGVLARVVFYTRIVLQPLWKTAWKRAVQGNTPLTLRSIRRKERFCVTKDDVAAYVAACDLHKPHANDLFAVRYVWLSCFARVECVRVVAQS